MLIAFVTLLLISRPLCQYYKLFYLDLSLYLFVLIIYGVIESIYHRLKALIKLC